LGTFESRREYNNAPNMPLCAAMEQGLRCGNVSAASRRALVAERSWVKGARDALAVEGSDDPVELR
jgi:hypothetical protein